MNYSLMSTYKCNWNCPYCVTNTHSQPDVTDEDILFKLNEIQPNSEVSLSGGEPGLVSKENIEIIFNNLLEKNCKISINTNGLFFKKYPEYDNLISYYLYHFSENLDLTKDHYIPEINKEKITFMLVVTNENYSRLDEFLEKYKDITFSIFAATKNKLEDERYILSKKNSFEIYKKYKDRLDPDSIKNLLLTCKETERNKRLTHV